MAMQAWQQDTRAAGTQLPVSPYVLSVQFLRGQRIGLHELTPQQSSLVWAMMRTRGAELESEDLASCDAVVTGATYESMSDDTRSFLQGLNIPIVSPQWVADCFSHARPMDKAAYTVLPTRAQQDSNNSNSNNNSSRRRATSDGQPAQRTISLPQSSSLASSSSPSAVTTTAVQRALPDPAAAAAAAATTATTASGARTSAVQSEGAMAGRVFLARPSAAGPRRLRSAAGTGSSNMDATIVDDTAVWQQIIEQLGSRYVSEDCPEVTHFITNKRDSEAEALEQRGVALVSPWWLGYMHCLPGVTLDPTADIIFRPTAMSTRKELTVSVTGYLNLERQYVVDLVRHAGLEYRGTLKRSTNVLICKSATGEKFNFAQRRSVPCVHLGWLYDTLAMGEPQPFDRYAVTAAAPPPTVTTPAWTRDPANQERFAAQRQVVSVLPGADHSGHPAAKRAKTGDATATRSKSTTNPREVRVAFTSVPPADKPDLIKKARELKLKVVPAPKCTHLIVGNPTRTSNFLRALCVCDHVLRVSWLQQSHAAGFLVQEEDHFLQDREFERTFNFDLRQSLRNQKEVGKGKLFEGITFFVTPNVRPDIQTLTDIVEAGGGSIEEEMVDADFMSAYSGDVDVNEMKIVVSCVNDLPFLTSLFDHGLSVYTSEIILSGALNQRLALDAWHLRPPA